jgi:hypothetical protein
MFLESQYFGLAPKIAEGGPFDILSKLDYALLFHVNKANFRRFLSLKPSSAFSMVGGEAVLFPFLEETAVRKKRAYASKIRFLVLWPRRANGHLEHGSDVTHFSGALLKLQAGAYPSTPVRISDCIAD